MLFSSTIFLFRFLPWVLLGSLVVHPRLRNAWLLAASLLFYGWGEPFVVAVMLLSVLANWAFGLWTERDRKARLPLLAALGFNLGVLVCFKYLDFLTGAASDLLQLLGLRDHRLPLLGEVWPRDSVLREVLFTPQGAVRLPIGVSFFTFQAISYVIDVRRGVVRALRDPLTMGTYKSLFPQLIAGPIVRYADVADQLHARSLTIDGFATGVRRFVLGLAKKMLVANTTALAADGIFALPAGQLTPALAWFGVVCFTAQIYFDFSGYSDMAIGLGHMLGFRFRENFEHPYVARSLTEFWRRWHISLSSWFRDYLYVPLGGNRRGRLRTYVNLALVFALCGLWHGASWSFLVWGLWHGAFLVLERLGLRALVDRWPLLLRHLYLLLVVMVGWVFFRAETLGRAGTVLAAMCGRHGAEAARGAASVALYLDGPLAVALVAAAVGSTPLLGALVARVAARARDGAVALPIAAQTAATLGLALLFWLGCLSMAAGTYSPFLYFRF